MAINVKNIIGIEKGIGVRSEDHLQILRVHRQDLRILHGHLRVFHGALRQDHRQGLLGVLPCHRMR